MAYSFTNNQKKFIKSLSARTGLNQRVVAAWVFSEMNGGAARGYEKRGYNNWLNIGHTDSGNLGLTKSGVWSSPERAAAATADFLRGKRFGPGPGIVKIIKYAGQSPDKQMSAIANSGWASSSYEKGNTLRSIYRGLGGSFSGSPSAPKSDSTTGGVKAPAAAAGDNSEAMATLLNYAKMKRQGRASVSDLANALVSSSASTDTTPAADSPAPKRTSVRAPDAGGGKGGSGIKELFYDPQGAWKGTTRIPAIGGHSNHVHVAAGQKTVVRLGKVAQRMGLRVAENPAFDKVDPVHVPNSYHYSNRAIDVSGSPQKMAAFTRYVRRLYGLK
jgi:hypothetical protein